MEKEKDVVKKWFVRNDKVVITIANTTDLVNCAIKLHDLTPTTSAVLGRCLTMSALLSAKITNDISNITSVIDGGGPVGKIICIAKNNACVKGYLQNPNVDLDLNEKGKLDVGGAVGKQGKIKMIMDMGFGVPYAGETDLVSGEIAEDFAKYFVMSLQQPCAIALGVLMSPENKCLQASGLLIEMMPDADEEDIAYMENIVSNIKDFSKEMNDTTIDAFIKNNFSDAKFLNYEKEPKFSCECSRQRVINILKSMQDDELESLFDDKGEVVAHCDFCNKNIIICKEDIK